MNFVKNISSVILTLLALSGATVINTAQASPLDAACAAAVSVNSTPSVSIQPSSLTPILTPALVVTKAPLVVPAQAISAQAAN